MVTVFAPGDAILLMDVSFLFLCLLNHVPVILINKIYDYNLKKKFEPPTSFYILSFGSISN
jgi:hypothetical protein